jgi:hypothetical protein
MTRHEAYKGIYDTDPDVDVFGVFFAFSDNQLLEGLEKFGYKKSDIVHVNYPGLGLYGPREKCRAFLDEYDRRAERVAKECNPQDVYEYEFNNYECDYTGNDEEAIGIVFSIFGKDRAKTVERRRICKSLDEIEQEGGE